MKHRATKRVSTQSILYFPPPPGSLSPAEKTKKTQTQSHFKTVYKGDFQSKRQKHDLSGISILTAAVKMRRCCWNNADTNKKICFLLLVFKQMVFKDIFEGCKCE